MLGAARLLIVPYGIETLETITLSSLSSNLLIVPYGIETWCPLVSAGVRWLLIVPYGIETLLIE